MANDMHLDYQLPTTWYENGLHCDNESFHVRGHTLIGVPGIVVGHNPRIAWGITYSGADTQDLYLEKINPENPDQYEVNGSWVDMEIDYEPIIIEGEDEPYILLSYFAQF